MIRANHSKFHEWFFDAYIGYLMRSDFREWIVVGNFNDSGGPVLMIGNHFSWWDGFFGRRLNQMVFRRKFYIMMLEEQLTPRIFLSKLGAFSIKRNSRDAIESVNYAIELLHQPGNLLMLFPQGKFQSQHQYPLSFEQGWHRILKGSPAGTQLVFTACLTDYFAHRKPALTIYLEQADKAVVSSPAQVELAYNTFLQEAIRQQTQNQ
jgi:1-acyl-sn-glycerol-3-phosphate acyltransferase